MPEPQRAKVFARAERKFDLMQELGADLLLVCSNVSPDALGGIDRAAADFHELGERAAERGMRVGFEALAWGRHVNDYRDAWEVVRRADHPAVGLVLDSFHILVRGHRPRRDPLDPAGQASSWCRWPTRRCWTWITSPGAGTTAACRGRATCRSTTSWQALQATGFDGLLSLEIFNDRFRAGSARSVAVDGQRSLICHAGRAARGAPARRSPALPALPPRAPCRWRRVRRVRHGRERRSRLRDSCCAGLGFARAGAAPLQGGDALAAGRHQHRREQRQGGLRAFLQHHARHLGVRHRAAGR